MAGFPKKERQRIIDEYLATTGRNWFHPGEFVDWLRTQKDHECYSWFEFDNDEKLAREHRISMARRMVSGLRISVSEPQEINGQVSINVTEFPSMISPMASRREGGGYVSFDPEDAGQVADLQRQGIISAKSWLGRYAGVLPGFAHALHTLIEEHEDRAKSA